MCVDPDRAHAFMPESSTSQYKSRLALESSGGRILQNSLATLSKARIIVIVISTTATHHQRTSKVFFASLFTPALMPKAIEDPALLPTTGARTRRSSQDCLHPLPCPMQLKTLPCHTPPQPYERSDPDKPAYTNLPAQCHRRPCPATHHYRTNKVFLASLLTPPSIPGVSEDPKPAPHRQRTNNFFLTNLLKP